MAAVGHILIVEDRAPLRRLMQRALEQEGFGVTAAETATAGCRLLAEQRFDLVLTDLKLGDGSGLDVLAKSRRHQPEVPVVVLTAFGTVQTAVEAMKLGAVEFLEKPLEIEDLYELVRSHLGVGGTVDRFEIPGAPAIVGRHPRLGAALRLLKKVAATDSTVLLTGESGTGKELFARGVHALSPRATRPFVAVNCAAIPESLIESELFGHEKGAFTGASRRQKGRFEIAAAGTIFLDEIGELKPEVQGKVLRVLEERTFESIGGTTIRTDARIVAATNRELRSMVRHGEFRQDLYYRLDVFPIALPPLRERPSDVPLLARHLTHKISQRLALSPPEISPEALDLLQAQPWPGNVRQLANVLERAIILADDHRLRASDLSSLLEAADPVPSERQRIRQALAEAEGDKHQAAGQLGISYRTLQRKVRQFDLEGFPRYRT